MKIITAGEEPGRPLVLRAKSWVRALSGCVLPRWLDRWSLARASIVIPASLLVTVIKREVCLVTWQNGWVHRYREGSVKRATLGGGTIREMRQHTLTLSLAEVSLKPGDVVIAVGGGIGEELYVLSELVGADGIVLSIEAHPVSFRLLEENIALNSFENVRTVHAAASAQSGSILIGDDSKSLLRNVGQSARGTEIPSIRLDELIALHGLARIRLLKMNIEGAEVDALEGLSAASAMVDNVAVSCHDFLAERTGDEYYRTKARVKVIMERMGYLLTEHPQEILPWARDYVYGRRP